MIIYLKIDYTHQSMLNYIIDWFENQFGFRPTIQQCIQFILFLYNVQYSDIVEELLLLAYDGIRELSVRIGHLDLPRNIVEKLDKIIQRSRHPSIGYSEALCVYIALFYRTINRQSETSRSS